MSIDLASLSMPYLCCDRDRHGNERWYVRMPGRAKIRIREAPGTEAFTLAYWAARRGETKPAPKLTAARAGTFRWLAQAYLASADFRSLDARYTQREKRAVLEALIEKIGDLPAVIDPKAIREAVKARTPAVAKKFMAALRSLYAFGVEMEMVATDPTMGIRYRRPRTDGHHTWTDAECAQYEAAHPLGTMARTAYEVGLNLACRRADAARIGRPMVRGDEVSYTQNKNRNRSPVRITQPITPRLREALTACQGKGLTWIETQHGRPFTAAGFGNRFREWCSEAGLPAHCTFHGLRKATAVQLAEADHSSRTIMAVLGDRTLQQAEVYTRAANDAAMARRALTGLHGEQIVPPVSDVGQNARKTPAKSRRRKSHGGPGGTAEDE